MIRRSGRFKFVHSLNFKIMCLFVSTLVLGIGVFFALRGFGSYCVKTYYMSDSAVLHRCSDIYNEFRLYVLEKQVSSRDVGAIELWNAEHPHSSVSVSPGPSVGRKSSSASNSASTAGRYYVRFTDGICQVFISDSSEDRQYFLCNTLSAALSGFLILLLLYLNIRKISRRIAELSRNAQALGCGDLSHEIPVFGNDELSLLAREIDDMRRSILELVNSEREALSSNNSLVTTMSHDLRTPMTALIGYLELLKNSEYKDENQRQMFTESAYKKSMELKALTDELFRYFIVFGGEAEPPRLLEYNASILLDQLLGERIIELRLDGYNVRVMRFQKPCSIKADILSLKRIFDNIFSNIRKYAEPSRPVAIIFETIDDKYISVCFSNSIKKELIQLERNRIGLKSCSKIAEQLGGRFKTAVDAEHFAAELIMPAYPPLDED